MDISMNIYEVQKVIKRLSVLDSFKRYCADDPFAPSAKELTQLQEDVTAMLNSYMNFLREWDAGDLVMKVNNTVTISNPDSNRMGKNAPAYKDDIDVYRAKCLAWQKRGMDYKHFQSITSEQKKVYLRSFGIDTNEKYKQFSQEIEEEIQN